MLIQNNESRIHQIASYCKLLPGLNDVPDDKWAEAKKIKVVQHLLDNDVLAEMKSKRGTSKLGDFPPGKQLDMIEDCNDADLLSSWRDAAKGAVAKAIDVKLDQLKKKAQDS